MFTGIIRHTGKISKIEQQDGLTEVTIDCPAIASTRQKGDSVAVDGACLTVIATSTAATATSAAPTSHAAGATKQPATFTVQAIPETLARTIIPTYKENAEVNLETPLKLQDELHGHMVQGHVDFVGTVASIKEDGASKVIEIGFALDQAKYLAFKGSVTVNGVSLTVSCLNEDTFEISLIPETLETTNLKQLKQGHKVNIEVDLIARYLDSLLQDKAKETTYSFLKERNLI